MRQVFAKVCREPEAIATLGRAKLAFREPVRKDYAGPFKNSLTMMKIHGLPSTCPSTTALFQQLSYSGVLDGKCNVTLLTN